MSNPFVQEQANEIAQAQGPPGVQNLAQPTSPNPSPEQSGDGSPSNAHNAESPLRRNFGPPELSLDRSLHLGHSKPQGDGLSLQAGHYCRLPNGNMEWVSNPDLPRVEDFEADVEMTTPLARDYTSASRRNLMAGLRKQSIERLRESRSRKGDSRALRIHLDPPQMKAVSNPMVSENTVAQSWRCKAVTNLSSTLKSKSPNQRLNPQPIQQISVNPSQYHKRQIRTKAELAKMGARLEEEQESASPAFSRPTNELVPSVVGKDHNGAWHDEFTDEGFEQESRWPAQHSPSDFIPAVESFYDTELENFYSSANAL